MSLCIRTYTGGKFYFDYIGVVKLDDIAHALALTNRFGGHTREPYSVAQHSVMIVDSLLMQGASDNVLRAALLHDAAEAFLGDVTRPLKALLPDYIALESSVQEQIAQQFGIPATLPEVKAADQAMLWSEMRDLLPGSDEWQGKPCLYPPTIVPWDWWRAKRRFMQLAEQLGIQTL